MAEILGPFRSAHNINENGPGPRSLLELRIHAVSAAIRRKPDWHTKRLNSDIVARWKKALASRITPEQFQVVVDELECYDKLRSGCIEVAEVDGVWKAPCLIPAPLAAQYTQLVDRLSNIPNGAKDWHPGSDGKVLDLIHPGLYLLVFGFTRPADIKQPGPSNGVPIHPDLTKATEDDCFYDFFSSKYQWIPTPVDVDANSKVRFLSYINNLHPKHHSALYDVLSDILAITVPLFERTLSFLKTPCRPKINLENFTLYYDDNYEPPRQGEWEDNQTFEERQEAYRENRPLRSIPVDYKSIPETPPITLGGRKLQIFIKIQEIQLTPDKPSYHGEKWHLEGMANEAIVASAIYCYHCTNVSDCTLSFQEAVCTPMFEEGDERGVREVYGFVNGGQVVQKLGSVPLEVHV
jgi:hypothetical protein